MFRKQCDCSFVGALFNAANCSSVTVVPLCISGAAAIIQKYKSSGPCTRAS